MNPSKYSRTRRLFLQRSAALGAVGMAPLALQLEAIAAHHRAGETSSRGSIPRPAAGASTSPPRRPTTRRWSTCHVRGQRQRELHDSLRPGRVRQIRAGPDQPGRSADRRPDGAGHRADLGQHEPVTGSDSARAAGEPGRAHARIPSERGQEQRHRSRPVRDDGLPWLWNRASSP